MLCPCCSVAEVSSETDTCDLCGYSIVANVTTKEGVDSGTEGSAADASKTTVKIASEGQSGRGRAITIRVKDKRGKPLKAGGDTVVVAVTGANRARPRVTDVGNGSYTATYTPVATGTDKIAITLNGVPVAGSPFTSTVLPGPADASQTSVTVPEGTAGAISLITITVSDANGNKVGKGGDRLDVEVSDANEAATVEVIDNDDCTYTAQYTPTTAGTDEITIRVNGKEIAGSPFTSTIKPGRADPSTTIVRIPSSGTPGQGTTITVKTCDANGNRLTTGGDPVVVRVTGGNKATPRVVDVGNGTYTATYTPTSIGTDKIAVRLRGKAVHNSPFTTIVEAGEADASQTAATVPAGTAGAVTTIVIAARDAHGNKLSGGGVDVSVVVGGANSADPEVTDNGDSTYTATYMPTLTGLDEITITLDGAEIPGSPFESQVDPGPVDPTQTQLVHPETSVAGEPNEITILTHDEFGNPVVTGGEHVTVVLDGANEDATLELTDNEDGSYTVTYLPTKVGTDRLSVTINGTQISDEPLAFAVQPGPPSLQETLAEVAAGSAGSETRILVVTRDAHGNVLAGGGQAITMKVDGANAGDEIAIHDNQNGTYTGTYTPTKAGDDYITVMLGGEMIGDSPRASAVEPGPADAAHTTATLPSTTRAGTRSTIFITVHDPLGNRRRKGGDDVDIAVSGPNADVGLSLTDNDDGTYLATFNPRVAGTDEINVTVGGVAIADSPFVHSTEPGDADPVQTVATGPESGTTGEPVTVVVTARDRFGNPCTDGRHRVDVSVTGANDGCEVVQVDNHDGTYTATYTPKRPGKDRIIVTLNETHIGGEPVRIDVHVGAPSAQSTVEIPAGRAGKVSSIKVIARDTTGNAIGAGGARVLVNVSVANSAKPSVTDHGDGTYTASYTPTRSGSDYIAVSIDGKPLNGSPFTSRVAPGPTDAGQSTAEVPSTGMAGEPTRIVIRTKDVHGNEITHGGQRLTVSVSGANDGSSLQIIDNDDGTFTASYTPTRAGTDQLLIALGGGEAIGGGVFTSTVRSGAPSPKQTSASFPQGIVGVLTKISVTARDKYRNPVAAGQRVGLSIKGANEGTALQITDHKDGTYSATYTPTVAGTDSLIVSVDDEETTESPIDATVHAGSGAADRSVAKVVDGVCGEKTEIVVHARDAYGNDATRGGDLVDVVIAGANHATHVGVVDNADGTYSAMYTPTIAGIDTITIRIDGTPLPDSPFERRVAPGRPIGMKSEATVPSGTVGRVTVVAIRSKDNYGNLQMSGGASVAVKVDGANVGAAVEVIDHEDGNYSATYHPKVTGVDTIDVVLNGTPVAGNPFSSTVGEPVAKEPEQAPPLDEPVALPEATVAVEEAIEPEIVAEEPVADESATADMIAHLPLDAESVTDTVIEEEVAVDSAESADAIVEAGEFVEAEAVAETIVEQEAVSESATEPAVVPEDEVVPVAEAMSDATDSEHENEQKTEQVDQVESTEQLEAQQVVNDQVPPEYAISIDNDAGESVEDEVGAPPVAETEEVVEAEAPRVDESEVLEGPVEEDFAAASARFAPVDDEPALRAEPVPAMHVASRETEEVVTATAGTEPIGDVMQLHAIIICPRCAVIEIASDADRCELCGWQVSEALTKVTLPLTHRPAPVPEARPVPNLVECISSELGERFELEVVVQMSEVALTGLAREEGRPGAVLLRTTTRADDPGELSRFRKEMERARSLSHSSMMRVLDFGTSQSLLWYTVEYKEGTTLEESLGTGGPLSVPKGLELIKNLAEGLEYVHGQGVIHGRLRAQNIVVDGADYTLCEPMVATVESRIEATDFEYMAPELFANQTPSVASDVYALATLAYEVLSGARPFSGGNTARDYAELHRTRTPPPLAELRREVPIHVSVAVLRALKSEPNKRFRTVRAFVEALQEPKEIAPLPVPTSKERRQDLPRVFVIEGPTRRFPIHGIGIGALAVMLSVGVYRFLNRPDPSGWEVVAPIEEELPIQTQVTVPAIDSLVPVEATEPPRPTPTVTRPEPRPTPRPVQPSLPGRLFVNATPWGQLFIDGESVGTTPRGNIALTPGKHVVRIVRLGFEPFEREINVVSGQEVRMTDIVLTPRDEP